ncbi:hypothetical protein WSM22_42770 [Cytophagales bacterium WSM2-2]|nr:hypothetical protein WSM22_42770 [Cytophagales bacterium WSM2-2]
MKRIFTLLLVSIAFSIVSQAQPTISIGAPSATNANNASSVTYTITYGGATAVTLANGDVSLNVTGGASASLNVTGSGLTTRTVTLTNFTGNGTVGISIAAATATDAVPSSAPAAGPSATISVDNTAPTISIGAPSATNANNGASITYTITYGGADAVTLANGDVSLNVTGGASATVNVTGSGLTTRTVTLTNFTGNGTVGISIASGTASDLAGNTAAAAGPSTTIAVDNTAPTISIGAPSASNANNGASITYTITYGGADAVTLANGDVSLNVTGGASATVNVTGSGLTTRTVTLTNFTGNGTVGISIAAGTASDLAGNTAAAAGPSTTIAVDNTAPTISIGAPSASNANNGASITYTITYGGADAVTLANGDVSLNVTGGASATVNVTGSGLTTRTVTLTNFTGNGTVGISIAVGTASDLAGNTAASAGPSTTIAVDNVAPTISIGAPSATIANNGASITYTITYGGADGVTLANGNITLNTTGGASATVNVTGSGLTTRTVTLTNFTGNGTVGISIASGTASDLAGNTAASAGPSTTIAVDNTAPTISIGAPSASNANNGASITYTITYGGADAVTLANGNVTLNVTGGASATVNVTGSGLTTRTVTLTSFTGNGTVGISIASGTASDLAGNTAAAAGPSTTITVDNNAPLTSTVTTLTTSGGTVVATYWNATNTGFSVVVPLTGSTGDGSLDGGTVQIQVQNTTTNVWVNVPGTGLSTITNLQRTGGSKTVAITAADLEAAFSGVNDGFREGAVGGAIGSETQLLQVRAVVTDIAGNSTNWTKSATNIDVDQTPPSVSSASFFGTYTASSDANFTTCNGTNPNTNSNREYVHLVLSEALALSNGAVLPIGSPGFSASGGTFQASCINKGGNAYHPVTSPSGNVLHLESSADGQWSSTTTFSFTPGSTVVKDPAGNEMGTITNLLPSDTDPPDLATGLVFFPNGAAAETIVFKFDQDLAGAVGTTVTGFTPSQGAIAAGANYNSGTRTVTFTSQTPGTWDENVTLTYNQATGNVADPSNNKLPSFSGEPIFLTGVHIQSNNGTNTAFATTGNTITLTFTVARPLAATPTVTFYGATPATTVTGPVGSTYTATLTMTAGMAETVVPFVIDVVEVVKTTTVTATTDGSSVTFDKTAPTTPSVPDLAAGDDTGINNDNYTSQTTNLTFSGIAGSVENNATVKIFDGTSLLGTTTASGTGVWTIDLSLSAGTYSINIKAIDAAGNTSNASGNLSVTVDTTNPLVSTITLPDTNPNSTGTVHFSVTFDSNVTGVDATDFSLTGTATAGGTIGVTGSNASYSVTVSGLTAQGSLGLKLVDDNSIIDLAGNPLGGAAANDGDFTSSQYTLVLPQPTNHATSFAISSVSFTSFHLSWLDATGGTVPTGYLITVARSGATATVPSDGTAISNQTDLIGSTTAYLNVAPGVQQADFTSLLSGEAYTIKIYPYTNSGTLIDYKINGVVPTLGPTAATTTLVDNFVWVNSAGGTGVEPLSFPSTTTSSGVAVVNFRFQVYDNGWGSSDNASTKITQIKIQRDLTNDQIGNWANALQGAELFDGSTTKTGVIDPSGNFITFSGLYDGVTEFFGEVPDDGQKYYYVKVILKTALGGSLSQNIDNKSFVFKFRNADVTLASNSSTLNSGNDTHPSVPNSIPGRNKVDVIATQLDFSTSPSSPQLVLANVTSSSVSPDFSTVPVVRARDVNGNTDTDYLASISIGSTATNSPTSFSMTNGVASLSGLQYQDSGAGQLTASTTTPAANTFVPASGSSGAVTVNYSAASTMISVSSVTSVSSLQTSFASLQPYTFSITDDGGAGGDGSPTRISQIKITKKSSTNPIPDWRDILNVAANGTATNAGALIYDFNNGAGGYLSATVTVNQNDITITSMLTTNSSSDLGYIGDNQTKTYQLYIWFKPTMTGGLQSTVDLMNFDFEIIPSNITFASQSSLISGAQTNINSGLIDVDVEGSKFNFITNLGSPLLPLKDINLQQTTPQLEVVDANGNRDLDFNSALISVSNGSSILMNPGGTNPITISSTSGLIDFPNNFQFQTTSTPGTVTLTVSTSTTNALGGAITSKTSNPVTVQAGDATTITNGVSAPATISSLINTSGAAVAVFNFDVNDDPGATPANQNDGLPTLISKIIITANNTNNTIADWSQAIAGAILLDGNGHSMTVSGAAISGSPNSITFNGIPTASNTLGYVPDNGTQNYTLKIWLKSALGGTLPTTIDGSQFEFEVLQSNVTLAANSTTILAGQVSNSGNKDVVAVVATQIDLTTPSAASFVSINTPFTPVFEARDANKNRDLGFTLATGTVTAFSNAGGVTMANGPVVSTTQFTNGVLNFGSSFPNFQFTSGNNNDNVTLSISAGAGPITTGINFALTLKTNTIAAGAFSEPLTISSLGTSAPGVPVFDFKINDDDNQASGTDGNPTKISQIKITQLAGGNDIADWTQLIASATLTSSAGGTISGTVNATDITFASIPNSTTVDFGFITDNSSTTFTLAIVLKSTLGGTLPSTVDNLNLAFEVLAPNINLGSSSSSFSTNEKVNSGATNNAVQVIATKLKWTTDLPTSTPAPSPSLLVNKDISVQTTAPAIEALDVNNNRDLNYVTSLNITNAGSLPMSSISLGESNLTTFSLAAAGSAPLNGGLYNFPADFQYNTTGNGQMTAVPISATTVISTSERISNPITIRVASSSTITAGALPEPSTISSLTDDNGVTNPPTYPSSGGIDVFDFTINDDPSGTPPAENDGNPTRIQSFIITQATGNQIVDWTQAIAAVEVRDDSGLPANRGFCNVNATSIDCGGGGGIPNLLSTDPGYVPDNGSKTYTLKIWLKEKLGGTLPYTIDGFRFKFEVLVSNVVTNPAGTSILAGEKEDSGNNNTVTVDATQLDFTQLDNSDNFISPYLPTLFPSSGSIFTSFSPRLAVEAHDANANRDLGFTSTITAFSAANSLTFSNGPVISTDAFIAGTYKLPANFQYTSGNNQRGDLTMTAGSVTSISPAITLISAFESALTQDPTFVVPATISYVNYQESVNIQNTSTSYELVRALLVDGSRSATYMYNNGSTSAPLNTTTDSGDGLPDADVDGATTNLTSVTIRIYRPSDIRRIALYSNGSELPGTEIDVTSIGAITSATTFYDFVWNGSPLLVAPDNSQVPLSIRVSFRSSSPEVVDHDDIRVDLIAAAVGSGSQFFNGNPANSGIGITGNLGPFIGGQTHGSSPQSYGKVDVIATSLDFTTQPSAYAGINEPVGPSFTTSPLPSTSAGVVTARDKFTLVDLDFNPSTITITDTGGDNITPPASFLNGVLNLNGMKYNQTGNGTLKVVANGLDSSNPPGANTSAIPGTLVNVVNVAAALPNSGIIVGTGTPLTASIKGGSQNQVIFGVTFTAQGATGTDPLLSQFTFSFDIPFSSSTRTIFENFVIKEVSAAGTKDIKSPTINGNFTLSHSTSNVNDLDLIIVDLSAIPRPLFSEPTKSLTYLLVADVNASANISTPAITPKFVDAGYLSATDKNIVVSKGTASGSFDGNVYSFASTKPPVLKVAKNSLTYPYSGQLNVDPAQDHITLEFDTKVGTLDGGLNGGAELFSRTTNTKVANLVAPMSSGNYLFSNDFTDVVTPLRYNIQFLPGQSFQNDEVYYVLIKKGSFDPINKVGTGISDLGLNFFGGISSSTTLYFKISSNRALLLGNAKGAIFSNTVGSIQTQFDQFGTAYYLVVPHLATAPTASQVKTPSTYLAATVAASGNYAINQINSLQTVTFAANFLASQAYDVYVYAENDALPNPIPSGGTGCGVCGVYGSNRLANGGGPTIQFTAPASPSLVQPSYLVCPNSYVTVSDPIVVGEIGASDFTSGTLVTPTTQDFNILLPPGYAFDGVTLPTIQFIGADFHTSTAANSFNNVVTNTLQFVSNSVLKVSYKNFGTSSVDYIVISNLTVIGLPGSASQSIYRFYGNNTSFASPTATLATIGLFPSPTFTFDNSYSSNNTFPTGSPLIVNAIPDNYNDTNNPGAIRLLPNITVSNDYNASIFTGSGVSNDLLTLSAVPSNSAFNITMNHTDPNGCVSQISQQYLVYDHISPISKKLGVVTNSTSIPQGTAQAVVNSNFKGTAPSLGSQTILHNELAGYELVSLTADLPAAVLKGQATQIMSGTDWRQQIVKIPNTPTPVAVPPLGTYNNYNWDFSHILNALTEPGANPGGSIKIDPYYGDLSNRFDDVTGNKNTFWKGGSLGAVEFTGLFRSTADLSVYIPFRQNVELFVPAVPLIEVVSANLSSFDRTDPTQNNSKTPDKYLNLFQYTGFNLRSGTITTTAGSAVVTGVGTAFTKELTVGASINDDATGTLIGTIQGIANDQSLTLAAPAGKVVSSATYTATGYQGTSVFCEQGGTVTLNGFPAALAGTSSGAFAIYDFATYNFNYVSRTGKISTLAGSSSVVGTGTLFTSELVPGATLSDPSGTVIGKVQTITDNTHLVLVAPSVVTIDPTIAGYGNYKSINPNTPLLAPAANSPFIDNGNGSMTLDPTNTNIRNSYKDVLVTYTYQANNSPAVGTGYIVIRVTPNPIPQFTIASAVSNQGSSVFDAFCTGSPITFDASSAGFGPQCNPCTTNIIANYVWDFGDPNSGLPNVPSTVTPSPVAGNPPIITAGGAAGVVIQTTPNNYIQAGTSAGQTYDKPVHNYTVSSTYTVSLSLTSNWGCQSRVQQATPSIGASTVAYGGSTGPIKIGDNPTVDFIFEGNCVSDLIKFSDKSSTPQGANSNVAKFDWKFGDGATFTGYNLAINPAAPFNYPAGAVDGRNLKVNGVIGTNVTHIYSSANFYPATLTTTTDLGCTASVTKSLAQLPLQKPSSSAAFEEFFNANNGGGWLPLNLNGTDPQDGRSSSATPSSWVYDGDKWRIPNTYAKSEKSALYSACLDLSSIPRPVIQYNTYVDLKTGEGLVLQYSKDAFNIQDKGKGWEVLGTTVSGGSPGLDWYNSGGLPSNPGTGYNGSNNPSGYGWSDKLGHAKPKHALEEIVSATLPNDRVILRFAFASLSNAGGGGISIDSIRVGSRTRTILFENFTTTDAESNTALSNTLKVEADAISTFVNTYITSTQLVNINYHIGFMGKDPFNLDNPADPSARALYYNVSKVPYAYLDGAHSKSSGGSDLFKDWGKAAYDLQTLELAKADFLDPLAPKLTSAVVNSDGSLQVDVNFTPRIDLPVGNLGTLLHIAVLEKSISTPPATGNITTGETQFQYVLKKMLPNAAGTKIPVSLGAGSPLVLKSGIPVSMGSFKWFPEKLYSQTLTVVVFLQNEATKEIYQADLFDVSVSNVVTAVEPLTEDNIKVYPNPSDQEFTVELPYEATQTVNLRLANQLGQYVEATVINEGERTKKVSTQGLSEGVYILQIGDKNSAIRTKVVVLHK